MKTPLIVKIATALVFFNSFVLFEEFVIDRYGFGPHIPFYRIGDICTWDIIVALTLVVFTVRWHRREARS